MFIRKDLARVFCSSACAFRQPAAYSISRTCWPQVFTPDRTGTARIAGFATRDIARETRLYSAPSGA